MAGAYTDGMGSCRCAAFTAILFAAVGACGLTLEGAGAPGDIGADAAADGTLDVGAADATRDAEGGATNDASLDGTGDAPLDVGPDAGDASTDAPSDADSAPDAEAECIPTMQAGDGGVLQIGAVPAPLTVDGDLRDWPSCGRVTLDRTTAAASRLGTPAALPAASLTVRHDGAAALYVGVHVTGTTDGNATSLVYLNDSVEIYVDGDGMFPASGYDSNTLQIVVDHLGHAEAYKVGVLQAFPAGVSAAAAHVAGGYVVEVRFAASALGQVSFSDIGFDFALNKANGTAQQWQLIYAQSCTCATGCCCPNGDNAPFCEARQFAAAHIVP
jgi:hypothetical protein